MEDKPKSLSTEEVDFAMCKHFAYEQLQKFIQQKEEYEEEPVEFKEFWLKEFFELETIDDITHFMKSFK